MKKSLCCLIALICCSFLSQTIHAKEIKPISHYENALLLNVTYHKTYVQHFEKYLNEFQALDGQMDKKAERELKEKMNILQKKINRANYKIHHLNKKIDSMEAATHKPVAVNLK